MAATVAERGAKEVPHYTVVYTEAASRQAAWMRGGCARRRGDASAGQTRCVAKERARRTRECRNVLYDGKCVTVGVQYVRQSVHG